MGEELMLQLEDMAHGGDAVGRHNGKAVFVPYGIAGESVRVSIVRDKDRFAHARLLEVLEASPQRVSAPCPYFGTCGGCQWQHLAYDAQLEHKRRIVDAQLRRIGGLPEAMVEPVLSMDEPWRYRNHVQFSVGRDGQLGFLAANSHDIVPIDRCLVMHPLLEEILDSLDLELPNLRRLSLRAGTNTGEQMLILEMEADEPPELEVDLPISCLMLLSDGTSVTLIGSPYLHESLAGSVYRISPTSFFQVNSCQTERLVSLVTTYLQPEPHSVVIDAYCGVGTFTVALAARAEQVIGIESNASAIADARANTSQMDNVAFIDALVEEAVPTLVDVSAPLVVLDPPRTGLDGRALSALAEVAPARIVYVSSDPATLARDLGRFVATGYRLQKVQPIDMFPQTCHIECVALLTPIA
jgi:23S rRNA (uracil1939-C5)-methyltransferase